MFFLFFLRVQEHFFVFYKCPVFHMAGFQQTIPFYLIEGNLYFISLILQIMQDDSEHLIGTCLILCSLNLLEKILICSSTSFICDILHRIGPCDSILTKTLPCLKDCGSLHTSNKVSIARISTEY